MPTVVKMATLRSGSREGDGPAPLEHRARRLLLLPLLRHRLFLLLLGQKGSDLRVLGVVRAVGLAGHRGRSERQRRRADVVGSEGRRRRRGRVAVAREGLGGGDELAELLLEAEGADSSAAAAAPGVVRVESAVHAVGAHVRRRCFEILHLCFTCLPQPLRSRIWVACSFFPVGVLEFSLPSAAVQFLM